jgi:hypothetical protein
MKTYGGSEGIAPPFFTSALSGGEWSTAALLPGKEPPVPIGYEADWTSEAVLTLWKIRNLFSLPETEPLISTQPVNYPGSS